MDGDDDRPDGTASRGDSDGTANTAGLVVTSVTTAIVVIVLALASLWKLLRGSRTSAVPADATIAVQIGGRSGADGVQANTKYSSLASRPPPETQQVYRNLSYDDRRAAPDITVRQKHGERCLLQVSIADRDIPGPESRV